MKSKTNKFADFVKEGDTCHKCDKGEYEYTREGSCSCHINPPCSACVDAPLTCNSCWYQVEDNQDA